MDLTEIEPFYYQRNLVNKKGIEAVHSNSALGLGEKGWKNLWAPS